MPSLCRCLFASTGWVLLSYSATLLLLDKLGSKYDENVIAWRAAQVETREEEMVML